MCSVFVERRELVDGRVRFARELSWDAICANLLAQFDTQSTRFPGNVSDTAGCGAGHPAPVAWPDRFADRGLFFCGCA